MVIQVSSPDGVSVEHMQHRAFFMSSCWAVPPACAFLQASIYLGSSHQSGQPNLKLHLSPTLSIRSFIPSQLFFSRYLSSFVMSRYTIAGAWQVLKDTVKPILSEAYYEEYYARVPEDNPVSEEEPIAVRLPI